jgi:hypothetical protein
MKIFLLCMSLLAASGLWWASGNSGERSDSAKSLQTTGADSVSHSDEVYPVMIREVKPIYPQKALDSGVTTIVTVKALVDTLGNVKKALAAKCTRPGFGFEEAAVAAALSCRFVPASEKGHKVAVWVAYDMRFALDEK